MIKVENAEPITPERAEELSKDLWRCQPALIAVGPIPNGTGIWFRVWRYSNAKEGELQKRFVFNSKIGWREFDKGSTFNLLEEVFVMQRETAIALANRILEDLESGEQR